jgi:hypothetical protein
MEGFELGRGMMKCRRGIGEDESKEDEYPTTPNF